MATTRVAVPADALRAFCRTNRITRLAFFGSVLRDNFRSDSDVDVLVEFEPGRAPGFLRLAAMEREFSALLGGRKADLHTSGDLSRYFRDEVAEHAVVQYAEG